MSAEMFELDCLPLCGSPPRSAPLSDHFLFGCFGSAAAAIFGEVVGGCGHTFVQDAGKEPFKSSLSLLVTGFFPIFSCTEANMYIQKYPPLYVFFTVNLSVTVCVFAAERTQGGKEQCGSYGVVSMVP